MGIIVAAFVLFFDISTVQSNAMNPTLWRGDVVLSWNPKLFSVQLAPGDIALFRTEAARNDKPPHSTDLEPNFLRCISSYGEEISYNQDVFQINGVSLARTELTNRAIVRPVDVPDRWRETLPNGAHYDIILPQQRLTGNVSGRVAVESGMYFLAGDNRMAALDSRQTGVYSQNDIRGRALFVLYASENNGLIGPLFRALD